MITSFIKMHGCGNDFVILDERSHPLGLTPFGLTPERAAALADRRTGIGCDQLIVIETPPPGVDAFMRIRNPDGSEAGACGNATRCVASLLSQEIQRPSVIIGTISGSLSCFVHSVDQITVDMGPARLDWHDIPLAQPMDTIRLPLSAGPVSDPAAASMGNPHATFFVPDLSTIPIDQIGPELEHDPIFPQRANIGFAQVIDTGTIRLKVWERGAGLTRACGSGACAALVNAHRRGFANRRASVIVDGGKLTIEWREDGHVLMTGPVIISFTGQVDLEAYPA